MKVAALCAGYGGLEMGLQLAGVDVDLRWCCENEPGPSKVMAHHHPNATNHGDLTQPFTPGPVDMITAGFPCQPFSVAGLQKGTEDERWLIDDVCRVARTAGARWLFLENVPGLLTANDGHAMGRVCAAMAENGFSRWEWQSVRASDVGAPHRRERWFCLATNDSASDQGWIIDGNRSSTHDSDGVAGETASELRSDVDISDEWYGERVDEGHSRALADTDNEPTGGNSRTTLGTETGRENEPDRSDSYGSADGLRARFGKYAEAVAHWERTIGRRAPDPLTYPERKGLQGLHPEKPTPLSDQRPCGRPTPESDIQPATDTVGRSSRLDTETFDRPPEESEGVHRLQHRDPDSLRINPRFVEWMMGLPGGHVTDVLTSRNAALKALGNGVVPQQAALAYRLLAEVAA